MRPTPLEKFQRFVILVLIGIGCFYGGYYFGERGFVFRVRKNPPKLEVINKSPGDEKIDFALFWDVWDMVSQNYLERPVDGQKMLYGAIQGMVSSLGDPYTSFLPPPVNKNVSDAINGKYQGIGAELGVKDGQLVVVSPLDGSPAKAAGLKAGDKILQIEGESTIGLTLTEAVAKIRGDSNTLSTLLVQTGSEKPRELKIRRGDIQVAGVTWQDKGEGTAYIRVSRFGSDTNTEWSKVVSEVNTQMKELDAIVLDVRGNPGGYLQSAVYIAEEFYRNKPVLYEQNATGELTEFSAKRVGSFSQIPAVYVLIDGGSASASEILAAALRANVRAKLIGAKSFGKGTIQDAKDFPDGSGIHITIAKWLTPEKEWIHKKGLEPDVVVERTDKDVEEGKDPQLDKALELAKGI